MNVLLIDNGPNCFLHGRCSCHIDCPRTFEHCSRPQDCFGTVLEAPSSVDPVHGVWSPWSTLNSPCINLKSGLVADCGGGKMKRHRSCSNPVPRFGGNT